MESQTQAPEKEKEGAFSNISTKSFLFVVGLLCAILAISGILSYIVPQGTFLRDENGLIIPDAFTQGEVKGIAVWRIFTAPFRVFASSDNVTIIMISVFLLIMSGVFNLLDKTGGIRMVIAKIMQRFSKKRKTVICITVLAFMAFGSFFGLFEELVTLLPIVILFMLSLGLDTMTGLGACLMAACFGFSAAITNPFSVGLIPEQAAALNLNFSVSDGVWLRILLFVTIYIAVCAFLFWHMRKIEKQPSASPTFDIDNQKRQTLQADNQLSETDNGKFKIFSGFFLFQFIILVLIAAIRAISGYAIPILAASFLIGGIVCGLLVCEKKKDVFKHISTGAVAMLPAVVMIAIASSVKLVMQESGIMDTVMHAAISAFEGKSAFTCILLLYFLILFLQLFIGSASAKIFLIMPIILPVATAIGISPTLVTLTYCIADGFTDVILPTNPVLLIGLSMANVSYGKWVKWTWKIQLIIFTLTILFLLFGVAIGY